MSEREYGSGILMNGRFRGWHGTGGTSSDAEFRRCGRVESPVPRMLGERMSSMLFLFSTVDRGDK